MAIGFNCAPACRAEWLPLKFPFRILRRAALYLRRAVPQSLPAPLTRSNEEGWLRQQTRDRVRSRHG